MLRFAAAVPLLALSQLPLRAFGLADDSDETPIPFLDADKLTPNKREMVNWNQLRDWIIPVKDLYHVSHYGVAQLKAEDYKLSIDGFVEKPATLTLDQIKSRPSKEVELTIECGGNGIPGFMGAIGNLKWTGTPLAPI